MFKLTVAIIVILSVATARNLHIINNCGGTVSGIGAYSEGDKKVDDNFNGSVYLDFFGTQAEFCMNCYGGLDYYDISLDAGYDVPVGIYPSDDGCGSLFCGSEGCPDAHPKTNTCGSHPDYTITFC